MKEIQYDILSLVRKLFNLRTLSLSVGRDAVAEYTGAGQL